MIETITEYITNLIGDPTTVTTWYWLGLIALGSTVFESLWRRWFGGGLDKGWLKIFDHRFLKHVVNCVFLFSICYFVRGLAWYWSLYFTLILQILYWTMTFGMYFDIGHSGKPESEYDYDEYNKTWFAPILNWFFPEEYRYTPFYDYVGMFIRFTYPLVLLFWIPTFNSGLLFLGTLVAMSYGLGWTMRDKSLLKKLGPTSFAEYLAGAFTGLYVVLSI